MLFEHQQGMDFLLTEFPSSQLSGTYTQPSPRLNTTTHLQLSDTYTQPEPRLNTTTHLHQPITPAG